MVKNILFTLLFIGAMVGCNNDDDDPPVNSTPPVTEGLIYLDKNGVTIKCTDATQVGFQGEIKGITYTVVD